LYALLIRKAHSNVLVLVAASSPGARLIGFPPPIMAALDDMEILVLAGNVAVGANRMKIGRSRPRHLVPTCDGETHEHGDDDAEDDSRELHVDVGDGS
jgi:hypothetical protein